MKHISVVWRISLVSALISQFVLIQITAAATCGGEGLPPWATAGPNNGVCDTSTLPDCNSPAVKLTPRTPVTDGDELYCRIRPFYVDEKGPVVSEAVMTTTGQFDSCNEIICTLPNGSLPTYSGRLVPGLLISVSDFNVSTLFSNEVPYLAYDSRCVNCTVSTVPSCSWNDEHCFINGTCYADGAANPSNPCERCNASTSTTSWEQSAGTCLIDGDCYAHGAVSPLNPCEFCDTASPNVFTPQPNSCALNDVCYSAGEASETDGCLVCDGGTQTFKPRSFTSVVGRPYPCYQLCDRYHQTAQRFMDFICARQPVVDQSFVRSTCLIQETHLITELTCISDTLATRLDAFCSGSSVAEIQSNPVACPS